MKTIQEAVRAYLQAESDVRAVSDRTRVCGEYPLLAVAIQEAGTVLVGGGALAEHTYQVTVTAVSDRDRDGSTALLSSLVPPLLRGIPLEAPGGLRHLHPLNICTEADRLTFSLELCVPVPPAATASEPATEHMSTLHFEI